MPTKVEIGYFTQDIGNQRFIWNHFLDLNSKKYEKEKKFLFAESGKILKELKRKEEFEFLNIGNSQALQQTLIYLDRALLQSSKSTKTRKGFPKFKSKTDGGSVSYPQNCEIVDGKLYVPKLKSGTKIIDNGQGFPEKFKTCTIIKRPSGEWYASLVHEIEIPDKITLTCNSKVVGIDLNSEKIIQLSDGRYVKNPKHLLKAEKRLKKYQRRMARMLKGSSNRNKMRIKVAKKHQHVANQRKDFVEKVTTSIAKEFDFISIEDLNVKSMQKWNGRMITHSPFGMIRQKLTWKANKFGKHLHVIDRFAPSSKTCNECGAIHESLKLSSKKNERVFRCPNCGHEIDRDLNASLNILEFGICNSELSFEVTNEVGTTLRACGETKVHDTRTGIRWVSMKQENLLSV
jgi:putative transposase